MNEFAELFEKFRELENEDVKWYVRTTPEQLISASIISGFDISDLEIYPLDEDGIPVVPQT